MPVKRDLMVELTVLGLTYGSDLSGTVTDLRSALVEILKELRTAGLLGVLLDGGRDFLFMKEERVVEEETAAIIPKQAGDAVLSPAIWTNFER